MLFGKSYLLSLVFSWLLPQGLELLEKLTHEHNDDLKKFIQGIVPGTLFDEAAWNFVEKNLPIIFDVARTILGKGGVKIQQMNHAVAECVAECKDKLQDA